MFKSRRYPRQYYSLSFSVDTDPALHEEVWRIVLRVTGNGLLYSRTVRSDSTKFGAQLQAAAIPFQIHSIPATLWNDAPGIAAYHEYWRSRFFHPPPIHYITHCRDPHVLATISCDVIPGGGPAVWHTSCVFNKPQADWAQVVEQANQLCEEWHLMHLESIKEAYMTLLSQTVAVIWTVEGAAITLDTFAELPFKEMISEANFAGLQARLQVIREVE